MKTMHELGEAIRNAAGDVRIERCIWLINMIDRYNCPPDFKNDFWDEDDDVIKSVLGLEGKWVDEALEQRDLELFCEYVSEAGKEGLLIQAATPVPAYFTESGHGSHGFGHYTTKWFYTETLEDVVPEIICWVKSYLDDKRAEAGRTDAA